MNREYEQGAWMGAGFVGALWLGLWLASMVEPPASTTPEAVTLIVGGILLLVGGIGLAMMVLALFFKK